MRYHLKNSLFFVIFIFEVISLVFSFSVHSQVQHDLAVTATVPPQQSDFQFNFSSTDGLTNVNQNTTLSYQITYGVNSSAGTSANTTIVADFSADLAPDSSHILDYVIGSASNAYGNAPPVIDLINRTITWTIPALPAGVTNQTVSFQLRTNSNYTGSSPVNFTTRAKMSNQYQTLPDQTISQTYQFSLVPVTSSPPTTTTISPTSVPIVSPSPTPARTTNNLRITNVEFTNISKNKITIAVSTNKTAKINISYGLKPNSLNKNTATAKFSRYSLIDLSALNPQTVYYLQISAIDQSGQVIKSEIYTFTTAKDSEKPNLEKSAAAIGSGQFVIPVIIEKSGKPFPLAVITTNTGYSLTYTLSDPVSIQSADMIIQDANQPGNAPQIIHMSERESRVYVANLQTTNSGIFNIFIRLRDSKGNLLEQNAAKIKVVPHLSVASTDKNPIGDTRIYFYYFSIKDKKYEPLSKDIFGNIKNPRFTNADGELNILLPAGKYKAIAGGFGTSEQAVEFSLGERKSQEFPKIYLKSNYFNPLYLTRFIKDWIIDSVNNIIDTSTVLSQSIRFFNIIAAGAVLSFILIGLLFFAFHTHIHPKNFIPFFIFHINRLTKKENKKYFYGFVIDENKRPLTKVLIEAIDKETENVLTHVLTNKTGRFYIPNKFTNPIRLLITKDGYIQKEISEETLNETAEVRISLEIGTNKSRPNSLVKITEHLLGALFESVLLVSILAQLFFFAVFGFARTLPFLALSCFNILLWIFYLKEHNDLK